MNDVENKITDEEAVKALAGFANAIYAKGCKDCLIGVGIGAGLAVAGMIISDVIEKRKEKKEFKKSVKEFSEFVDEMES